MSSITFEELLVASGNSLHYRVVNALRARGWDVLVSPFYRDGFSDKPREIDIVAQKLYPFAVDNVAGAGQVVVRLFIECKYVNTKTIFWFDEKDKVRAASFLAKYGSVKDYPGLARLHYHTTDEVAKLFNTENDRAREDWVFGAINQSLNSLIANRSAIHMFGYQVKFRDLFNYPLVVVNSFESIRSVDQKSPGVINEIKDPFLVEINYVTPDVSGKDSNEYFLIDFLSEQNLDDFLNAFESEDVAALKGKRFWELDNK